MEIDQLRAFASLAHTRNFSRTAEELGLVQSTVSMRIRLLEESVGKPLFSRTNRRVELTGPGETFLRYAERILSLCERGKEEIKALGQFDAHLAIGSTDSLWHHFLEPVILDFLKRFPKIALLTKTGGSHEVVRAVLDGAMHLGVGWLKPRVAGLRAFTVFSDEMVLVTGAQHPSAKLRKVGKGDLPGLPLLTFDWGGPFRDWAERVLPPSYTSPIHPDQLSLMISLVVKGRGAAFAPRRTVAREIETSALVALRMEESLRPPRREVYAFFKDGMHHNPGVAGWLTLMKENGFRLKK